MLVTDEFPRLLAKFVPAAKREQTRAELQRTKPAAKGRRTIPALKAQGVAVEADALEDDDDVAPKEDQDHNTQTHIGPGIFLDNEAMDMQRKEPEQESTMQEKQELSA